MRLDKICRIIADCPYGIHDISKTEPDIASGLPRFNMPFELGLFFGAKQFAAKHRRKKILVLDRERYRYQQFISDIAGQDIHAHDGDVERLIMEVAAWLRDELREPRIPGGRVIAGEYGRFQLIAPRLCETKQLDPSEITFNDFCAVVVEWLAAENDEA